MRLIKPYSEIWEQLAGPEGVYKQIERAGRVCYKSEDKITEDSAKPFVDNRLIKSGHYAMLEHGTVYLKGTLQRKTILNGLKDIYLAHIPEYPMGKVAIELMGFYITLFM